MTDCVVYLIHETTFLLTLLPPVLEAKPSGEEGQVIEQTQLGHPRWKQEGPSPLTGL